MSDFGGGIYLSTQSDIPPEWDMMTDSSGDVKTSLYNTELEKDVAFFTSVEVEPELGQPIRPITMNRIKARVEDALDAEDRIDDILFIEVNEIGQNTVEVLAEVRANDENIELVFEVEG